MKRAQDIDPANFSAQKVEVWILLGKREFAKALEKATILNKRVPDDVLVYGFLTDVNVELGLYDAAEKSCQWMLTLRSGNTPALLRVAVLRELFGDLEGAMMAPDMAFQSTPATETEDRAWILTRVAHLKLVQGKTGDAERALQQALTIFPGYPYALGHLAKVRTLQQRYDEAAALEQQRYAAAPGAANLFALAESLELAGRSKESGEAFAQFERLSRLEMNLAANSNHELAAYYLDHAKRPEEALRIAKMEFDRRQDIHTLDVYARALFANGRRAEARTQMERVLAGGVRDPEILRHAGRMRPVAEAE